MDGIVQLKSTKKSGKYSINPLFFFLGIVVVISTLLPYFKPSTMSLSSSLGSSPEGQTSSSKLDASDLLRLDAASLQIMLEQKSITSVDLVNRMLAQIEKHDKQGLSLHAMIAIIPHEKLITVAKELDRERSEGKIRGPFHGIPILVKDSIKTNPETLGVGTTVGSVALAGSNPGRNAVIVNRLIRDGLIIMGKTNLNEFAGNKGFQKSNGWSAFGNQTQSAFVKFDPNDTEMGHTSPCGSSTGSAVGVSAGYAPLSIGTESDGSLVQPANRAGLYTLKPTVGTTENDGVWLGSKEFVSVGVLAKSVEDLAGLTKLVLLEERAKQLPPRGFTSYLTREFRSLRIGFLDPKIWQFPSDACPYVESVFTQTSEAFHKVMSQIQHQDDVHVEYPVDIPPLSDLMLDGESPMYTIMYHEYSDNVKSFLSDFHSTKVRTMADIIRFNQDHADIELPKEHPSQEKLIRSVENRTSKADADRALNHLRNVSRVHGIDKLFEERNINMLAFSMECFIASMAAAAGYPIATMPMGILDYNGRPFSLGIMARAGREDLMFQFMSAFEMLSGERPIPLRLLDD